METVMTFGAYPALLLKSLENGQFLTLTPLATGLLKNTCRFLLTQADS